MGNGLILGRGETGKSVLARELSRQFSLIGRRNLVCDVTGGYWPHADHVAESVDDFSTLFWGSYDIAALIEEAGDATVKAHEGIKRAGTRGRHQLGPLNLGNCIYFITHRLKLIDPTVRSNCTELFLFGCGYDDAAELRNEFASNELLNAPSLKPGEFYHIPPGGDASRHTIDFGTGRISKITQ